MKTDYTLTPEYKAARYENGKRVYEALQGWVAREMEKNRGGIHPERTQSGVAYFGSGIMAQSEARGAQQSANEFYEKLGANLQNYVGRETPEQLARMQHGMMNINPCSGQMSAPVSQEAGEWLGAYAEARRSHAAGEPLIRTVCKIAARILFVLLLVGIGIGVMLK